MIGKWTTFLSALQNRKEQEGDDKPRNKRMAVSINGQEMNIFSIVGEWKKHKQEMMNCVVCYGVMDSRTIVAMEKTQHSMSMASAWVRRNFQTSSIVTLTPDMVTIDEETFMWLDFFRYMVERHLENGN